MNDIAKAFGGTLCDAAMIVTRVCHGASDQLIVGYLAVVFLTVLVLVWWLLR